MNCCYSNIFLVALILHNHYRVTVGYNAEVVFVPYSQKRHPLPTVTNRAALYPFDNLTVD
ncbi:MAG: hypothetical protein LBP87_06115 [Planctomycetaceae bacterium]|nr:hypothetical protein [Planctomycetaceae bacterium]